MDSPDIQMQME